MHHPQGGCEKTLKTSVDALVELNIAKNLIGSAMAGAVEASTRTPPTL